MKVLIALVAGFLTAMAVLSSVFYYVRVDPDEAPARYPAIVGTHAALGAVYASLAAFQFVAPIRTRWPRYHRWTGRMLVAVGLVVGATALFMTWFAPEARWWDRLLIGFFGVLFIVSLAKGLAAIRARRMAELREWMIRAFAIALGIATMRLIFIPTLLIWRPTASQAATLSLASFTVAFMMHAAVAEVWIRATRRQRPAPRLKRAS